jgi:hypothetical protein
MLGPQASRLLGNPSETPANSYGNQQARTPALPALKLSVVISSAALKINDGL